MQFWFASKQAGGVGDERGYTTLLWHRHRLATRYPFVTLFWKKPSPMPR
jgi:hypothetical protein